MSAGRESTSRSPTPGLRTGVRRCFASNSRRVRSPRGPQTTGLSSGRMPLSKSSKPCSIRGRPAAFDSSALFLARSTSGEVSALSRRPDGLDTRTRYRMTHSSRWLGHHPLKVKTRVRLPNGSQGNMPRADGLRRALRTHALEVRVLFGVPWLRRLERGELHKLDRDGPIPSAATTRARVAQWESAGMTRGD